jgi:hypothetical protein
MKGALAADVLRESSGARSLPAVVDGCVPCVAIGQETGECRGEGEPELDWRSAPAHLLALCVNGGRLQTSWLNLDGRGSGSPGSIAARLPQHHGKARRAHDDVGSNQGRKLCPIA